jgi:gliding motility-associated-like protein
MIVKTAFTFILLLVGGQLIAQRFPVTGQLPSTAFPVCGQDTFKQATVPVGKTHNIKVPGCTMDGVQYRDTNPFWYSFTCYTGGTLGFLITPNNLGDDYDWMLYDVTGHNVNDVFTNTSLIVAANWSGTYGLTGARRGGSPTTQCASVPADKVPTFAAMPVLIQGHKYLLLVSHYTDSQSGYSLSFGGGTAVINDPLLPHLASASIQCDQKTISVVLNKSMRCASVATDGSDFIMDNNPITVVSAAGANCNNAFDVDSVFVVLSTPLTPGNYTLKSKMGTDNNTLLDDCGTQLAENESVSFTVLPPQPTPMDSLVPVGCAPKVIQLYFADPMQCSSIAEDGSDFIISGTGVPGIAAASGICQEGLTNIVNVILNGPIVNGGNYQISLRAGLDGNTIINRCGLETPAGSSISFALLDTVSAAFTYNIAYGCQLDTIMLHYPLSNGVNQWQWLIDSNFSSNSQEPMLAEVKFGPRQVQHIVTNGFCSDTVTNIVNLDNILVAAFQAPSEVCPKDLFQVGNESIGHIVSWSWDFGDGTGSSDQTPAPHLFPNTAVGKTYTVSLIVKDNLGCLDTVSAPITKLQSCYITVPNAFTPNGDGRNDYLYPLNAYFATDLEFLVYNRYGQLVFETRDWTRKWDGSIGGKPQPTGTFLWTLRFTDPSGKKVFLKGTSVLIR